MSETVEGGCMCGAVRYRATIHDRKAYLCHCRMCQRASGNVSLAMKDVAQDDMTWLSGPDWYHSSPIAKRPYCAKCGTSLGFQFLEGSKNLDITIGSLDDPSGFEPEHHFGAENIHEEWLDTTDLKRIRTVEHTGLVERWKKATGEVPE